eukprot:scaffold26723_cov153-Skeletonema_menzelii.AAC.1
MYLGEPQRLNRSACGLWQGTRGYYSPWSPQAESKVHKYFFYPYPAQAESKVHKYFFYPYPAQAGSSSGLPFPFVKFYIPAHAPARLEGQAFLFSFSRGEGYLQHTCLSGSG